MWVVNVYNGDMKLGAPLTNLTMPAGTKTRCTLVSGFTCSFEQFAPGNARLDGEFMAVNRANLQGYLEAILVSVKDGAAGQMWSTSGLPGKDHAAVMLNPSTVQKKLGAIGPWLVIRHEKPEMLRYLTGSFWRSENTTDFLARIAASVAMRPLGDAGSLDLVIRNLPVEPGFDPFDL